MRVALVIGHSHTSRGASNKSGLTEFDYNGMIVHAVRQKLANRPGVEVSVVYRGSYQTLPDKINNLDPDLILSFHCNAFNTKASGTEVLYYHKSVAGAILAANMQKAIVDVLRLPDRGIKPKRREDRGGYLLAYTKAPCLIIEPFFIDNRIDLNTAHFNEVNLIDAYVKFITDLASVE